MSGFESEHLIGRIASGWAWMDLNNERFEIAALHGKQRSSRDTAWAVSEANLETMRRQYEVQAREGGLVPDLFAQDAEWIAAREDPDAATHHGVDAIHAYLGQWFGAFEETEFRVEEMIDGGDKVFSWIVFSGRGPTSGVPVELQQAQIATFRDGKISRIEEYYDRSEGLEAAGLSR